MKRESPSSRGRGLKSPNLSDTLPSPYVALFTRAWIEIYSYKSKLYQTYVALFTRAWIEISTNCAQTRSDRVALFTRAWIEIERVFICAYQQNCRPLHEGVDWNQVLLLSKRLDLKVALFTRAWIEIFLSHLINTGVFCRPLHEGVDWNKIDKVIMLTHQRRPLHEGVDWNTKVRYNLDNETRSPSSRGRGLKSPNLSDTLPSPYVALFTRAWIEIQFGK